ncbi:unnamed protein product [Lactuca saligna]|uniref:Uncharacterized protein n=1 Tax=Lactuca saligna TaxID=75948 RepID=A0AA35Z2Q3_LACSI|nr:unnamed protein product [Lactuca saligna]
MEANRKLNPIGPRQLGSEMKGTLQAVEKPSKCGKKKEEKPADLGMDASSKVDRLMKGDKGGSKKRKSEKGGSSAHPKKIKKMERRSTSVDDEEEAHLEDSPRGDTPPRSPTPTNDLHTKTLPLLLPTAITKEPSEQPPSPTAGKTKRLKGLRTRLWRCCCLVPPPPSFPGGIDFCIAINRNRAKDPLLLPFVATIVAPLPSMVDSHRHLPLLVVDAAVLVAIMFQPRLLVVANAALMSLRLLLSVPRDDHACISQGCECVAASSSSEVWSFGLARNQERAPPPPATIRCVGYMVLRLGVVS